MRILPLFLLPAVAVSTSWSQSLTGVHIGTGLVGSDSLSGGVYTISGSGNDIGSAVDANGNQLEGLRFVGQTLPQDGVFQARVIGMTNTNTKAKAGIEIRQLNVNGTNDPGAISAMVGVTPTSGLLWLYKLTTTAASINSYNPALSAPHWVKIVKDANIVSSYESADGASWNFINLKSLSFTGPTAVGLAVSSHSTAVNCTATFDNVSLLSQPNFGGPAPWTHQDIGDIGLNGAVHFEDPNWTLFGAGSDIWGAADAFHYSYRPLLGDGSIIAFVSGVTNTNPWAKAGIMLRQDTSIGSANVLLALTPGNGVTFQARATANGATVDVVNNTAITGSCWLKLERDGTQFLAYTSSTGALGSWQVLGSQIIPGMSSTSAPTIQMGLAETSHTKTGLGAAFFSDVQPSSLILQTSAVTDTSIKLIWPNLAPGSAVDHYQVYPGIGLPVNVTTTSFESVQLMPSTTYSCFVRAFDATGAQIARSYELKVTTNSPWLPSPWTHADLGATTVGGSTQYDTTTGIYTLTSGGAEIGGPADSFQYAWQPFTGDGQIVVHLCTLTAGDPGAKAGIMVREGTGASARYAAMTVTPGYGVNFEDRVGATGNIVSTTPATALPWLKLIRQGDTITGYTSADGTAWTIAGSATLASLASTVDLGLVQTSHASGTLASSTMDQVTVSVPPSGADPSAPAPPSTITLIHAGDDTVTFSWPPGTAAAGVTGYQILRDGEDVADVDASTSQYTVSSLTPAQSYWFNVETVDANGAISAPGPRLDVNTTEIPLPTPWLHADIGPVDVAGTATGSVDTSGATFTLGASGTDIWNGTDSFGFIYHTFVGDAQITAKVNGVTDTNAWAKAGVMMRANSTEPEDANAPYAFMLVTPGSNGVDYQSRQDQLSQSVPGPQFADPTVPNAYWVRLVRRGDTYRGYSSPDGQHWTQVSQENLDLYGGDSIQRMGLAVTAHGNATLNTVTFTNVTTGISSDPNYDSDGDGMPDQWEIANGLDPFIPDDGILDSDSDGVSNADEYHASTDPTKPDNPKVQLNVSVFLN